jgi:hypothetical protein
VVYEFRDTVMCGPERPSHSIPIIALIELALMEEQIDLLIADETSALLPITELVLKVHPLLFGQAG